MLIVKYYISVGGSCNISNIKMLLRLVCMITVTADTGPDCVYPGCYHAISRREQIEEKQFCFVWRPPLLLSSPSLPPLLPPPAQSLYLIFPIVVEYYAEAQLFIR